MAFFDKIFGQKQSDPRDGMRPLYGQIIAKAREPHWYLDGGVEDSIDGRFDMVATILTLVLLRLEPEQKLAQDSVYLTEIFIDDMDAQLREFGIGDMIVGKHIGNLLAALGGRLGAMRDALAEGGDLQDYIESNLRFSDTGPGLNKPHIAAQLNQIRRNLAAQDSALIVCGDARW